MPLAATPDPLRATACRKPSHATDGGGAVPNDEKLWLKILARYREPDPVRSVYEIVITAVPFFALWAIMLLLPALRLLAEPDPRRAGGRLPGPAVHDPARLRPRLVLPPPAGQRLRSGA